MADKRSRRKLFGKPIGNPSDEAKRKAASPESVEAVGGAAKDALTSSSTSLGDSADVADTSAPTAGSFANRNVSAKVIESAPLSTTSSGGGSTSAKVTNKVEWVPHRGKRALPLALGALGLVGLAGLQSFVTKGRVEDDLQAKSRASLKDEFPDLKVRFDGRDAYLEGSVVDAESRKRAHDLVRQISGVRHVKDPKVVSPAPSEVAAKAQVPLTLDTVPPVSETTDGFVSIAAVTGDTIPETTPQTQRRTAPPTTLTPTTLAPTTLAPTTLAPTTLAPTTLVPSTLTPTTLVPTTVPASVLATSVPTTIVVAPAVDSASADQPVVAVVPPGETVEPIRFGRASTDLEASTAGEIDRVAAYLNANPTVELGVAGYADARGTKLQNMALAKARAQHVKQALVQRGVDASHIKAVWFGDRDPVADNATDNGRAQNRRAEFRFFSAGIDAATAYGQDVSFTG